MLTNINPLYGKREKDPLTGLFVSVVSIFVSLCNNYIYVPCYDHIALCII